MRYALSLGAVLLAAAATPAAPPREAVDVVLLAEGRPYLLQLHVYVDGRPYDGRYDVYLRRWFAHLDQNGDGFLDIKEASRAPSAQQLMSQVQGNLFQFGGRGDTPPTFRDLDADGDGKVTAEEFTAYYRRSGFGPIMLANGNQFSNGTEAAGDVIFSALDTNGDGKLSKAELARAEEALRKFDLNDDEIITAQELVGTSQFVGRGLQQLAFGQTQVGTLSSGPLVVIPRDDAGRLRAAKVLFERYDKNRDGKLSRDELRLPADLFAKLDTDKDGSLKLEELAAWLALPADAVLALRLGKIEAKEERAEVLSKADKTPVKVDKTPSGDISLRLGDLSVQIRRSDVGGVFVNATRLRQIYLQTYKAADKGNKGFVTAEDVKNPDPRGAFLSQIFTVADRNGDGQLTEKELTDYLDLVEGIPMCLTGLTVTEQGSGLFEMLDADGDGRLSIREMRNAAQRLAELDREGKGFIARADIPRQVIVALSSGPPGFGNVRLAVPVGGRGVGADPRVPAKPARGPLWFRKMDLNGDGDISPKEWLGTPEEFKLIDEDGDGLISVEEAERYDRKRGRAVSGTEPAPERSRERERK